MDKRPTKKAPVFFSHLNCYRHFFDSLTLGELVVLGTLNREALQTINLLFKDRLLKEGIPLDPSATDFLRLYREVHLKSVILMPVSQLNPRDKINAFSGAKISKKTLFVDRLIESFSFGIKFVGYYFREQELLLFTKVDYLEQPKQLLLRDMHRRSFRGITQYSLEARLAAMLDTEGTLKCLVYMKDNNIHDFEEIKIDVNVNTFLANYNYLVYRTVEGEVFLISRFSNMNQGQSSKYRVVLPGGTSEKWSLHLTGLNLYLRSLSDGRLYSVALHSLDPVAVAVDGNTQMKVVTPTEFSLGDKPVIAIFPGLRNEILMLGREYKTCSKWSNEEVRSWFSSIGISGIDNILKYDKFTGKNLLEVDVGLMKDKLGIHNSDIHNKILSEIDLVKEQNRDEPELWGQGYNLEGQLCLNNGNKNVPCLTRLKIPELSNTDSVRQVLFGWGNTLILTQEDRMFLSYKKPASKRKGTLDENPEEELPGLGLPPKISSKKTNNTYYGGRKLSSHQGGDSPEENAAQGRRKKSAKVPEMETVDLSDHSHSSDSSDEHGKRHEHKKSKRKNSSYKQNRPGTKKKQKKESHDNKHDAVEDDFSQAKWIEITNLFQTNKNFKKSSLISVSFYKDDIIFFVNSRPDSKKQVSKPISDPVCVIKVLKKMPHYDNNRYAYKLNGEWNPLSQLEEQELNEHFQRNIEAFKFLPSNDIIWNRAERVLTFSPY